MEITTEEEKLKEQFLLILKLFINKNDIENLKMNINHSSLFSSNRLITQLEVFYNNKRYYNERVDNCDLYDKSSYYYIEKFSKILLYNMLSKIFNKKCPWGALTGIRPSKLFNDYVCKLNSIRKAAKLLKKEYKVSNKRISILKRIYKQQSIINYSNDDKNIDFYINIPFCVSKCYYCSFLSAVIGKCQQLVAPYVEALIYDIKESLKFIQKNNYHIENIYIGGGTPTSLNLNDLEKILKILPKVKELTVEAGRPDTITNATFELFNKYNVTRISINPQTFNNKTLREIGRNHTSEDCVNKYLMARKYNFIINMDLIAGLNGENFKDFKKSLIKAIELKPDNITVHTLCFKRTSNLNLIGGETSSDKETEKMVTYSINKLIHNGYAPYYLYKQKNTLANLENIGYSKNKSICKFNIDSMEEKSSIFACGANGISKRLFKSTNKIERFANVKNIEEYINRIDEMLNKKFDLFK